MTYETDIEREESIRRMAQLREAVEAYQASCTTRHREVDPQNHAELDAWWRTVPGRRKQILDAGIAREKREAALWLANAESRLPQEGDGRDSTNIQQYAYFGAKLDVAEQLGDTVDDRDGMSFAEESDSSSLAKDCDGEPMKQTVEQKQNEEFKAAYWNKLKEEKGTIVSTLDVAANKFLASSWRKVEYVLSMVYPRPTWKTPEGFLRLQGRSVSGRRNKRMQTRGDRAKYVRKIWDSVSEQFVESQETKFYTIKWSSKMVFNAAIGEYFEIRRYDMLDDAVVAMERRHMTKKSPRRVEVLGSPDPVASDEVITIPAGVVREWDGDKSDPRYVEWREPRDYDGLQAYRAKVSSFEGVCKASSETLFASPSTA
jgi:hypothetical protein